MEDFGNNLGEDVENLFKSSSNIRPPKPSVPTPTYQESAFIAPKQETTLYDVTNRKAEVPEVTKTQIYSKKSVTVFEVLQLLRIIKTAMTNIEFLLVKKLALDMNKKSATHKQLLVHYIMFTITNLP